MKSSYYKIADLKVKITFNDERDEKLIPSFAPFACEECADNELTTNITIDNSYRPAAKGREVGQFDCGGTNHGVYLKPDGGYQFVISDTDGSQAAYLESNTDFSKCTVVLLGTMLCKRNFGLNNSLMMAYAFSSADKNTLLMHSSVIRNGGKGYLCLGKSGTGKSTHTGLWLKHIQGSDLMNDDNPVVRYIDGETYVYGSPWSGKTPCYRNVVAPVGAFLRLEQKPENMIAREKPIIAFATLLPSCSTMKWDKRVFNGICDTISKILTRTPCFLLKCRPDEEAARLSYSTVTQQWKTV